MNTFASFEFTAYIGIDWADTKHDICIQPAGSDEREFDRIAHRPQDIEQWAYSMQQRFGGRIAIALELTKGPIVSALQKYDFFVLFPVNPSMLAKYREAFKPSRAKDDPTDAEFAIDLVLRHGERFKPLQPQSIEMRTLVHLVEKRRRLVEDRRRFSNRLIGALKAYYPQAVEWFSHRDTFLFCAFVTRWPTLKQVKRARRSTLERFFRENNARRPLLEVETATNLNATPRVEVEREPPTRITEMRWGQTTTVWWSWSWRTMVSANPLVMLFDAIAGSATWDAIAGLRFQWGADETTTTRGYSGVANVGGGGASAGASGLSLR